ncbi:hypothetical protein BROUX41_006198 [Berkeleyomyces rouxiae]|uniref:uncharacterized protein n=1 Tax=Berkeleyomyces rouxiae TaxID=2035830 RepID=UPI003B7731BB
MSDKGKESNSSGALFNFPDAEAKLAKIATKSVFEKQRADADAKRQREAAETAAIYEDFVKSFEADERPPPTDGTVGAVKQVRDVPGDYRLLPDKPKGFSSISVGGSGGGFKRHFGTAGSAAPLKSGPGSLGPAQVSFSSKKRPLDASASSRARLGFEDYATAATPAPKTSETTGAQTRSKPLAKVFNTSDDEDDASLSRREVEPVSRPTLRLAQLPPDTSPAFVRKLIPESLVVEDVQLLPTTSATGPARTERKSTVAIVTLAQDTPATQIDTVVSELQSRYLGFGFYLSLHRHLSSSSVPSSFLPTGPAAMSSSGTSTQPFGAKQVHQNTNHHRAARDFAPPTSYGTGSSSNFTGVSRQNLFHVPVKPPSDIRIVRTINKVLEQLLVLGPEFEALLMSRPEVQREERWAWLWDARSEGGVWYRWKLWEIVTSGPPAWRGTKDNNRGKNTYVPLFEGGHAWKVPKQGLPFEYTTHIHEFVSDSEYNSDSDSDLGGPDRERDSHGEKEQTFLNPLEKACLIHLLARLPPTTSALQKGDIARVTAFAITHANRGAAEVVQIVVGNMRKPLALTGVADKYRARFARGSDDGKSESGDMVLGDNEPLVLELADGMVRDKDRSRAKDKDDASVDTSSANLVGLYVVSDILSAASSSSVRHAWRFRQLFETALRRSGIFTELGSLAGKYRWGRLRAERWKRSVGAVLSLWEGWCVFQAETQAGLVRAFDEAIEGGSANDGHGGTETAREKDKNTENHRQGKWKSVEGQRTVVDVEPLPLSMLDVRQDMDVDDDDDVPGEPMVESDEDGVDVESESIEDDVEGEPIEDDDEDVEGEPIEEDSD